MILVHIAFKTPAVLLILLTLRFGQPVRCETGPCVVMNLTQADLIDLINPRPNGDLSVLVSLQFDSVFCSATVFRYLIIGYWSERHQFDFLVDESRGLAKDTEYFVALSGCDTLRCRTAGFVKVTPWKQAGGGGTQNLNSILIGVGCGLLILGGIAVGILVYCCHFRNSKFTDGNPYADFEARNSNPRSSVDAQPPALVLNPHTYLECDRHTAPGVDSFQHSGFPSDGFDYSTYAQINSNFDATGNAQAASQHPESSSGFEETSFNNSVVVQGQEDRESDLNRNDEGQLRGFQNRAFEHRCEMSGETGIGSSKNDRELQRDSGASGVNSDLSIIDNPDLASGTVCNLLKNATKRIYNLRD